MTSLDTHSYDSKWLEEFNSVCAKHDKFFEQIGNVTDCADIIGKSTNSPDVKNMASQWREKIINGNEIDPLNKVSPKEILARIEKCIRYRLDLEKIIESADIEKIDEICNLYFIPKSGDAGNDDTANADKIVVDNVGLEDIIAQYNISIINGFAEQLADINNGACIQGQTTRLFQIFNAFYL